MKTAAGQEVAGFIGNITIENVIQEGQSCGFRLTDMVLTQTFIHGDPFSNLLTAYHDGTIVVFDVETTGLLVSEDEIIEMAKNLLYNNHPDEAEEIMRSGSGYLSVMYIYQMLSMFHYHLNYVLENLTLFFVIVRQSFS